MLQSHPAVQVVWFRRDLRLSDHAALTAAAESGLPILALIIDDPADANDEWAAGSSSKGWWQRSLQHLQTSLTALSIPLLYIPTPLEKALHLLGAHFEIAHVFCHRYEEPHLVKKDANDAKILKQLNIPCTFFPSNLLFSPGEILKSDKTPYLIFTAFWKRCLELLAFSAPLPIPSNLIGARLPELLRHYTHLPKPAKVEWEKFWQTGEENTHQNLAQFLTNRLSNYEFARNFPSLPATSRMSAPLHFGEITPRQIFYAARNLSQTDCFFKEVGWREFAYHTLHFFPELTWQSLYKNMVNFPYRKDPAQLKAWQKGLTGYPIVDAGMRELLSRGTMHNRVRMIVGSFLTKDLLLPWQEGAKWFWQYLVDADLAANSMNWQWVAGSGVDPQPFFRIFHPVLQGKKFDPEGHYIRTFIPELSNLPSDCIHTPWQADESVLSKAKITLGKDYPYPIVDHAFARTRALEAYRSV